MNFKDNQKTFKFMLSNFEIAEKKMPADFKSVHWDAFPNGYVDIIKNEKIWPRMLRNALTIGFNDALISQSNMRFQPGNSELWKEMKRGDFPDLIKEENDKNVLAYISDQVKKLILSTDIEYVASSCIGKIGNPVMYQLNVIAENAKNYKINYNTHDVDDIYHSWFIVNQLNHLAQEYPLICEIGSGYGGLASKIKNQIKKSRIIIFDLPEVNAVQSYYLLNTFPEHKIFGYQDFLQYGSKILEEDFDFLIMPGWAANDLLHSKVVDAFINARSMMEMNREVIKNYFEVIHTSLRENGLFACINRYMKTVTNQSNTTEINKMAEYPFDEYWSPLYSFPSEIQPHIHFLIARREHSKPIYSFNEILKTIRQNPFRRI